MVICISVAQSQGASLVSALGQERIFPLYVLNKHKDRAKKFTVLSPTRINHEAPAGNFDILRMYATPKELTELAAFQDFLTRFVKTSAVCTVQCMLLWTEWVRFYKKKTGEFPALVLEKDFKDLVTNRFNVTISEDESRGYVFPGIKYVPRNLSFLN
jgi:hypothetical protein